MATTALSRAFHGQVSDGEGDFAGSGGNLNSVYAGAGLYQPTASDEGYEVGHFPAGALASGAEDQEFRISDSDAFNNLRGIAKTSYPFEPFPANDHTNQTATALADNFAQSDMAGVSSLLPGRYSYNSAQNGMSKHILSQFDAGTSTFNSLPSGATAWANEDEDANRRMPRSMFEGFSGQLQEGIQSDSIVDQFRDAFTRPEASDVPAAPFAKVYPNFGSGEVTYNFMEGGGSDKASDDIIRAFSAILPEGELAGTKKELQPVFSGINVQAVEQRPIMQSLAKQKKTLLLGGLVDYPDDLKIDPREALLSGSNIPADLVQTAGELASALDTLGYSAVDGLHTSNPYGPKLGPSSMLAGSQQPVPDNFYDYLRTSAREPLVYDQNIYQYADAEFVHQ